MGLSLYKKKSFKILLISGILIILGVFVIFNYSQILKWWKIDFEGVEAGTSDNIRGWAWGENMGWISMNCYNDFNYDYIFENCCPGGDAENCTSAKICQDGSKKGEACSVDGDCLGSICSGLAGGDYGVTYVDSDLGNYIDNALMGYAWSDKVGWICFGKSCKCADCASCGNYNTCINCSDCPNSVKPPHGWPFPWACVGKPTWTCSNNSSQTCINDDGCPSGTCVFSCSGDGEEDFLDISAPGAPCYSATGETLKAHWTMNTVNVIDSSNQTPKNNGTLMPVDDPPVLANGKFENALEFDGENDYIDITDSLSLSVAGNLVIEGWIKRGTIGSEQTIIGKWDEAVEGKSYRLWFDANNKLNFSVANDSVEATITQTQGLCFGYEGDGSAPCSSDADCSQYGDGAFCRNPSITDTTKWHHVVGKYIADDITTDNVNEKSLRLFIDGSRVNVKYPEYPEVTPDFLSDKSNKLYIGAKMGTLEMETYFNGIIDNVSVWSCGSAGFLRGRSGKDIWADAKMEVSGWAKVVSLGEGGWLKLQGSTNAGKIWGLYLDDYDTFYTIGGYMANRYADTSMDETGLIANWLMDEPSWTNSTGSIPNGVADSGPLVDKNHGTASGAVPSTDGKFNSAGEFDGLDDYIEVSDDATLDFTAIPIENFTIQFWIKPNSFSTNGSMPIVKRQSGAGYEIQITSAGYIYWLISDGTISKESSVDADALTVNAWNHVTIVFNRTNNQIIRYLNGVFIGTVDNFGSVGDLSNDLSLYIGGKSDTYSFNGLIDNVSIYNIAKTSTQILVDYDKQNPYCVGWDDYDHDYGDPPAPFDFEISEINNTDGGCYQLLVYWDQSIWAESYTYWRCDNVEESACDTCSYTERNILSGACDEYGRCSFQGDGLGENTGYCYKIQAHNETGSTYNSNGPIWKQTTLCYPENVEIDDDTCGEIQSRWDLSVDADGYNVYRSLNNDSNGCNYSLTASGCELIGQLSEAVDYDLDNDGTDDLVAQWKMNEDLWDGSNNEVRDSSGQTPTNHGEAKNGLDTTATARFDRSGNFDGADDYIDCGSSNNLEVSTATVQAWIKRASTNTRDAILADNESSALDKDHHLWFEISDNDKLTIIFGDGTDSATKYSAGTINDTDWHHVAVVRDDSAKTITFYIDGEIDSDGEQDYELDNAIVSLGNNDFWVGKSNVSGYESPFHGLIDNVAIYNVAKTAEQIRLDYEAGNCGSDNCGLTTVCHIQGVDDKNCGSTAAEDDSICCYTDKRILSYIDYYYRLTATSEAGESPASNCYWTDISENCPAIGDDPCCPNGRTICFPPVETEER